MYHQIGNASNSYGIKISNFRKQLNYFQKFNKAKFTLTFDHGTIDHLKYAVPELEKRGLKGIFFILTMIPERFELPVEDKQRKLEQKLGKKLVKILCEELKFPYNPRVSFNYLSRFKFYSNEERYLRYLRNKKIDKKDYLKFINKIFVKKVGSEASFIKKNYLSWKNIKGIFNRGHIIGSHSHNHIGDYNDYKLSLNFLKDILNTKVDLISYPNGEKNINDDQLKKLKIKKAFTTNLIAKKSLYRLPRIDCNQLNLKKY